MWGALIVAVVMVKVRAGRGEEKWINEKKAKGKT